MNVNLIYPEDKGDLALTLGGRKRKVKRSDFDQIARSLGISKIVCDNIYKDFAKQFDNVQDWVDGSFLTNEYKERYMQILSSKMRQLEL